MRTHMRHDGTGDNQPPLAAFIPHVGHPQALTFTAEKPPVPAGPEETLSQAATALPESPGVPSQASSAAGRSQAAAAHDRNWRQSTVTKDDEEVVATPRPDED